MRGRQVLLCHVTQECEFEFPQCSNERRVELLNDFKHAIMASLYLSITDRPSLKSSDRWMSRKETASELNKCCSNSSLVLPHTLVLDLWNYRWTIFHQKDQVPESYNRFHRLRRNNLEKAGTGNYFKRIYIKIIRFEVRGSQKKFNLN